MAKVVGPLAQKDDETVRQVLRFRSEQNKPGLRRSQAKHRPDDPSEWGAWESVQNLHCGGAYCIITRLMQSPVMATAEQDGELVTDFHGERSRLGKMQMSGSQEPCGQMI